MELLPEIGGHILENTEDITVDVHNPDVNVRVEIRSGYSYIMCDERMGAGGLPVGVGGKVMVLLSGGIDSPVAAYLTMKRAHLWKQFTSIARLSQVSARNKK